jgi:6-pyruvoyltetrahydropterin/6-carboxytetrahydropterin synthase
MYSVKKWIELDAGHRVPFHDSKCHNVHGHRYRVTAEVAAELLVPPESQRSDAGMVVDFGVIKKVLVEEVHDPYDHQLMLWVKDPLIAVIGQHPLIPFVAIPCIPTAEELAAFWAGKVGARLRELDSRLQLVSLEVRETPTSTATFFGDYYKGEAIG